MSLLTTDETKKEIIRQVSQAQEQLQVISAFCKIPAVELLDKTIHNPLKSKKLMVRFLLSDIIHGATDITLYEYCKSHGWQMYVRFDLHAKTYVFDKKRCILGSANLTSRGLDLSLCGNYELSCYAELNGLDIIKIESLFNNATLMTDELYNAMKIECEYARKNRTDVSTAVGWSDYIKQQFKSIDLVLFTYDFPTAKNPDYSDLRCFDFLELDSIPVMSELQEVFRCCKAFSWLYGVVERSADKTCYFGRLTEELHNTLINDPKPYRKEVKELLSNLLSWASVLGIDEIKIDTPNHSQRVRIIV